MISSRRNGSLLKAFQSALEKFPVRPGDKVLVAVSGGADSVCLLHLFRKVSHSAPLSLHVAHLNHGFRPEAKTEASFVERLASDWDIPVTSSSLPVPEICKKRHLSKQEGARRIRYHFLEEAAEAVGARWIALGHTADDQAETFLMHLLRGAGVKGLGAIPEMRGRIIRPLLEISRKEILGELSRDNIPHMEDPSNQSPVYRRNRIRHELIPLLEEYNPGIRKRLLLESRLLQDEDDFMQQHLARLIPGLGIEIVDQSVFFDIPHLESLHVALRRRLVRWGIHLLSGGLKGIHFEHVEAILSHILPGPSGNRYHLPSSVEVEKRYTKLILRKSDRSGPGKDRIRRETAPVEILGAFQTDRSPSPGRIVLPQWNICLNISIDRRPPPLFSTCTGSFDFDRISFPLFIRAWRPGDRFVPTGMTGRHKKLQDFFVDAKIPGSERSRIPILVCSKGILWVMGHRLDERFQATAHTNRILIMTMQTMNSSQIEFEAVPRSR